MSFYEAAKNLHIFCGTLALASFWATWVLRKGTPRHRIVGRSYLIALCIILLTAVPLAVGSFQRGSPVKGAFLLYLIVITGTPAWLAYAAVRYKTDFSRYIGGAYRPLAWLSIATGAVVLGLGIHFNALLLTVFSWVGIVTGVLMLRYARKVPVERNWWLSRHYGSIIATGAATHVAFINLGLSHLIPAAWAQQVVHFSFLSPLALAIGARIWLDRRYVRKSGGMVAPAREAVA